MRNRPDLDLLFFFKLNIVRVAFSFFFFLCGRVCVRVRNIVAFLNGDEVGVIIKGVAKHQTSVS